MNAFLSSVRERERHKEKDITKINIREKGGVRNVKGNWSKKDGMFKQK